MFNDKLKFLRERKGLTQEAIASIIKIERSHYAHYENGDKLIPVNYLNIICNYYKVSFDYIFGLTEKNKYDNSIEIIIMQKCSTRIKEFRKENNLTQNKLANQINIAKSILSYYENAKLIISTHALFTICKKYNISADYLLGKIDSPKYLNNNSI